MGKLTIDFETRSCVSLKDCGSWVYAEDETTDVMCLALKEDEKPPVIWLNPGLCAIAQYAVDEDSGGAVDLGDILPLVSLEHVQERLDRADVIEAHNFEFERSMWQMCFGPKYGLPMLPLEKCRCSLSKASYHSLPRSLAALCKALGTEVQKDEIGAKIMMKMCRPKRLVKAEWAPMVKAMGKPWTELKAMQADLYETIALGWHHVKDWCDKWGTREAVARRLIDWYEDPEDIIKLCRYCMTDVESEHHASEMLPDLPERELRVWQLDQEINARGIAADCLTAENMTAMVEQHASDLLDELAAVTNGEVTSPKQTAKFKAYVNNLLPEKLQLEDVRAETVKTALKNPEVIGEARRLLEIRKSLALSSVAKYAAIVNRVSRDGRVRASLLYHGAGTGRFSGRGIQPQNFPRGKFGDPELAIEVVNSGNLELVKELWGDPTVVASTCLRGILTAAPGKELTDSDYANIEGRVVAWLAGEEWKVQSFRDYDTIIGVDAKGKPIRKGPDNYKLAYSRAFGIPVEDVDKAMRQIGKVMELACGYQGGKDAFAKMAAVYGVYVDEDRAEELVKLWRNAHPMVVALWAGLDEAAVMAVAHPGKAYAYRSVAYRMSRCGRFLLCRLPSNRLLHYPFPELQETYFALVNVLDKNGKLKLKEDGTPAQKWKKVSEETARALQAEGETVRTKTSVVYMTVNSTTNKFERSTAYGGLLTENVVQAVARDIMVDGMFRVEDAGYPVVLTIHDEIMSEHDKGFGSLEEFSALLSVVPPWADGLPVAAAGWRGQRYKKD